MPFITFIVKNILRRPVRSLLTLVGVALAVGSVVALLGIADGFERSFLQILETHGIDVVVSRAGRTDRMTSVLDERLGSRLAAVPGVEKVTCAHMDMMNFPEVNLIGVFIQGWPTDSFLLDEMRMQSGRRLRPGDKDCAMFGAKLAERLDKSAGDTVNIEMHEFRVVGIYESYAPSEENSAIVPLEDFQRLMDRQGQVMAFQLVVAGGVNKDKTIEDVCRRIKSLTDDEGRPLPLDAKGAYDYVRSTLQIQQAHAMAWLTSVIALIIGAIGMLNTMIMSVFERTHEIGILRAIGWRKGRIMAMILSESLLLCAVGAAIGSLGAIGLTKGLSKLPAVSGIIEGRISASVLWLGFALAILVGLIGGIYPAYRGASLAPTEAIRHE